MSYIIIFIAVAYLFYKSGKKPGCAITMAVITFIIAFILIALGIR